MFVSLGSHIIFVVLVATSCNDGGNCVTISSCSIRNLSTLLVARNRRHIGLSKLGGGSAGWSTCNASNEIMTECNSSNKEDVKERVHLPVSFIAKITEAKDSVKLWIVVNCTGDSVFMIA